jgi:hypothetical protein
MLAKSLRPELPMSLLDELQTAVDNLCCGESDVISGAARDLIALARKYPALVGYYSRTLTCVACVRAPFRDGAVLAELLASLGLADLPAPRD